VAAVDGILIVIQLLAGMFLGGFFAAFAAKKRYLDLKDLHDKQEEKIERLQLEVLKITEEKAALSTELYAQQKQGQTLEEMRRQFVLEFENISNKILKENTLEFSFHSQEKIQNLLSPLESKMELFQSNVQEIYKTGTMERLTLKSKMEHIADAHKSLVEETGKLARALKGDIKKQGCWGELILERVLESSGLRKNEEYILQGIGLELQSKEGKRLQPDVIINLPDNKQVIIDAKMSYCHYESYCNSASDSERAENLKKLVLSMKEHIRNLEEKKYQFIDKLESPEFVLLFVPIEAIFSLAIETDPSLFEEAWKKSIILVSPANLLAVLRTIESIWKVERQNRNTQKIAEEAASLYDKFVDLLKDLEGTKKSFQHAHEHLDKAMMKLSLGRGSLTKKTEDLKKLGLKTKKQIPTEYLEELQSL
jgi:DNA recombination protein RmuC